MVKLNLCPCHGCRRDNACTVKNCVEYKQWLSESWAAVKTALTGKPLAGRRVYIAGPITGVPDYRARFAAAEQMLTRAGAVVINPAVLPGGMEWSEYMPICYAMLDACDSVYLLRGWRDSKGAQLERQRAVEKGMEVFSDA